MKSMVFNFNKAIHKYVQLNTILNNMNRLNNNEIHYMKSLQSSSSAEVVAAAGADAGTEVNTVDPGAGGGFRNPLEAPDVTWAFSDPPSVSSCFFLPTFNLTLIFSPSLMGVI
jgi:hypothetical protein